MLSLMVVFLGLIAVDDGAVPVPKDSADRAAYEAARPRRAATPRPMSAWPSGASRTAWAPSG